MKSYFVIIQIAWSSQRLTLNENSKNYYYKIPHNSAPLFKNIQTAPGSKLKISGLQSLLLFINLRSQLTGVKNQFATIELIQGLKTRLKVITIVFIFEFSSPPLRLKWFVKVKTIFVGVNVNEVKTFLNYFKINENNQRECWTKVKLKSNKVRDFSYLRFNSIRKGILMHRETVNNLKWRRADFRRCIWHRWSFV